ncbi:glutamate--cysteine ligase [Mycolicibacterium sphagni]|uniref:Putative glutamate--cysteine ligase 2 n=1 Tax=Mycolicibacterium sphagni TaxID=1786 RepID=A0A255DUA0_9MYCO|nr:glutamate--cysteine ligase [Mycolicibacterium sphagni]OYN82968.1 carboxylate--amine ligase [Mycolicibacterium sphagni]
MVNVPSVGVEEEFLLVDPSTGEPVPRNVEVADYAAAGGVDLQLELTTCQVETATEVTQTSSQLRQEITRLRRAAAEAAEKAGARLLAVGLPPTVPHSFPITDNERYRDIGDQFGMIAHEQGICGCHVHVEVPDRDMAIAVSNRLRPWLPLLLALTANSAIYRSADSGHASWRSVLWNRWPSAGPPPHLDSAEHYDAMVAMMIDAGAMLDDGMVYWDVRPSKKFPTIEVRVADVPATVAETVLLATLTRAAVMTALAAERSGAPVPRIDDHVLRAAHWKAAHDGLDGQTMDVMAGWATAPTSAVLGKWLQLLQPALADLGDDEWVHAELGRLLREGNGAMRQRGAWRERNEIADVLAVAAEATLS